MLLEQVNPPQTDEFLHLPEELYRMVKHWSKSNVIRHIIGGAQFGETSIRDELSGEPYDLQGDDIQAAVDVGHQLLEPKRLAVRPRDSRSLRIQAQFYDLNKRAEDARLKPRRLVLTSMQKKRMTTVDETVVSWPLLDMMPLEGGTTQWAAAAILLQDRSNEEIMDLFASVSPRQQLMLQKSKSARARILAARALGTSPTLDERDIDYTLMRQLQGAYTNLVEGPTPIKALHSEDVFAAIFSGAMTPERALKQYPQIVNHETNRYQESIRLLNANRRRPLHTLDHRAALMAALLLGYRTWTKATEQAAHKTIRGFAPLIEAMFDYALAA